MKKSFIFLLLILSLSSCFNKENNNNGVINTGNISNEKKEVKITYNTGVLIDILDTDSKVLLDKYNAVKDTNDNAKKVEVSNEINKTIDDKNKKLNELKSDKIDDKTQIKEIKQINKEIRSLELLTK